MFSYFFEKASKDLSVVYRRVQKYVFRVVFSTISEIARLFSQFQFVRFFKLIELEMLTIYEIMLNF